MRKKKRESKDIIFDILSLLSKRKLLKTQLMYKANLNFESVNKYIRMLRKSGLIRYKKYVTITEKGKQFIENVEESRKVWDILKR